MKFPTDYRPELAVATDEGPLHLRHACLDVAGSRLCATDGRILAIIPVDVENGDTSGPVSREALEFARENTQPGHPTRIRARRRLLCGSAAGGGWPRPKSMSFPPVDDVVPLEAAGCVTFAIDVALLARLADALGASGARVGRVVRLTIPKPDQNGEVLGPILVRTEAHPEATGVIMPCRTGGAS